LTYQQNQTNFNTFSVEELGALQITSVFCKWWWSK